MQNSENDPKASPQPVEDNYSEHKQNPGPSAEAVQEKDNKGGGQALRWILPIVLIILFIVWFFFK